MTRQPSAASARFFIDLVRNIRPSKSVDQVSAIDSQLRSQLSSALALGSAPSYQVSGLALGSPKPASAYQLAFLTPGISPFDAISRN